MYEERPWGIIAAAPVAQCAGRFLSVAITATLLTGTSVFAQSAPVELPEVAVESSSAEPAAANGTGRILFERRQSASSDVADILRTLPGVSAQGAGGFSSLPMLHGLGNDTVAVSVDGMPIDMACPNFMNPPLSYVDPQTIESISVIAGVTPVSMGGDNIGGAINASAAPPRFAKASQTLLTGEASAFYRSNGDGAGGALSATWANDRWSVTYAGSFTRSGDYDGGGNADKVRSTEYQKTDHSLAIATRTAIGLFELKGGYHYSPYEGFPNQWMDMTDNRSWYVKGHYKGAFTWGSVDLTGYYRHTDHAMNFLADKGGDADGGMPMDTRVRTAGYVLKMDIALSPRDTLRLGSEYHHEALNDFWPPVAGSMMMGPDTFLNINHAHRNRLGTYAEVESRWAGRLTTLVGLRNDQVWMNTGNVQPYSTNMMNMADAMAAQAFNTVGHGRHDSNWGATALLRYQPGEMVDLEIGYARKAQSPNIYERYAWGRGAMSSQMIGWYGDGNGYVGNLALKPERADTISAALTLHGGGQDGWRFKIAPFYTRAHDYIDARKIADITNMMGMPSGFVQLQFVNEEARLYGVDVSGEAPLLEDALIGSLRAKAVMSYVRGDDLTNGGGLYHQMPLNGTITFEHRLHGWWNAIELELVANKDRVDAIRNEPKTSGYALLNLRTGYSWHGFALNFSIENVANRQYSLPLGGMSFGDYDATGVLRPVPGRGRSFNVGLSLKF